LDIYKGLKHVRREWFHLPDKMDPTFLMVLDVILHDADERLLITHSFSASGHSTRSFHYKGRAIDALPVGCTYTKLAGKIHDAAKKRGIVIGLGLYPFWENKDPKSKFFGCPRPGIHFDNGNRNGKSTYWHRDAKGIYHYTHNFHHTLQAVA